MSSEFCNTEITRNNPVNSPVLHHVKFLKQNEQLLRNYNQNPAFARIRGQIITPYTNKLKNISCIFCSAPLNVVHNLHLKYTISVHNCQASELHFGKTNNIQFVFLLQIFVIQTGYSFGQHKAENPFHITEQLF